MEVIDRSKNLGSSNGPTAVAVAPPPAKDSVAKIEQQRGTQETGDSLDDLQVAQRLRETNRRLLEESKTQKTLPKRLRARKREMAEQNYVSLIKLGEHFPLLKELQNTIALHQKAGGGALVLPLPYEAVPENKDYREQLVFGASGFAVLRYCQDTAKYELHPLQKTAQFLTSVEVAGVKKILGTSARLAIEGKELPTQAIEGGTRNKWLRRLKNVGKALTLPLWVGAKAFGELYVLAYKRYGLRTGDNVAGFFTVVGLLGGIVGLVAAVGLGSGLLALAALWLGGQAIGAANIYDKAP